MAQWKPLPDNLEPRAQLLVVRLRELKDRLGISTESLARRTAFSRSSWDRYLNGKAPPSEQAITALARLAEADPAPLLALREVAEHIQREHRAEPAAESMAAEPPASVGPAPADTPVQAGRPGTDSTPGVVARAEDSSTWRRAAPLAAAAIAGVVVGAIGMLLWSPRASHDPPALAPVAPEGSRCDFIVQDGRRYAGHSAADRLVVVNSSGPDVAEVQCLLKYQGFEVGRIDGMAGRQTDRAVRDFQRAHGLPDDGAVGEQTWALLRR